MKTPKASKYRAYAKKSWHTWVSTCFGLGFLPFAPGTWGSLAGIPLGLYLLRFPIWASVLFCFALAWALTPIVRKSSLDLSNNDASEIVVDEVIGQALTLLCLKKYVILNPQFLTFEYLPISYIVWAFVLFRIFDIFKPFPANLLDRQKTVFGLFGDDIVAGLYAALVLRGIIKILPAL